MIFENYLIPVLFNFFWHGCDLLGSTMFLSDPEGWQGSLSHTVIIKAAHLHGCLSLVLQPELHAGLGPGHLLYLFLQLLHLLLAPLLLLPLMGHVSLQLRYLQYLTFCCCTKHN